MKEVSIIGVDLAKQVFQMQGATSEGEAVFAGLVKAELRHMANGRREIVDSLLARFQNGP